MLKGFASMLITLCVGGMNMQPVLNASPFTFASESRTHALDVEQNEDRILLDSRHGLAAIFGGMGSQRGQTHSDRWLQSSRHTSSTVAGTVSCSRHSRKTVAHYLVVVSIFRQDASN